MKPQIHQHRSLRELAYRLADLSGILLGMLFAVRLRVGPIDEMYLIGGCAAIIVFYLLGEVSGMYRNWRGVSIEREVLCAVVTWSATVPALLAMSVMTRHAQWVDRTFVLTWASATACLLAAIRIGARLLQCYLRSRGYNTRGYAVVGINDLGFDLAKRVDTNPQLGLKLVGVFDDRASSRLPAVPSEFGSTPTGTIHQLVQKARRGEVNMIYITFPMRAEKRIKNVLEKLGDSTASVYIVPDFFVFELLHSRWTDISGLPAVSVFENPFYGIDGTCRVCPTHGRYRPACEVQLTRPDIFSAEAIRLGRTRDPRMEVSLDASLRKWRILYASDKGRSADNASRGYPAEDVDRRTATTVQCP